MGYGGWSPFIGEPFDRIMTMSKSVFFWSPPFNEHEFVIESQSLFRSKSFNRRKTGIFLAHTNIGALENDLICNEHLNKFNEFGFVNKLVIPREKFIISGIIKTF